MKSFRLGVLAKVLHVLLSCMQLSEAQDVSNAVCKWNRSTSTCQQDQQGLIDLLTEAGEAHTFALFMTCQYVSYKSQCNNLSTCVWENDACRISSKKLVTQINSCFYSRRYQYSIISCKNKLTSISKSTTWINEDSINPASSCRLAVDYFSFTTTTCRLMKNALQCGDTGPAYGCEYAFSINNQANQFISDLRYVMKVSQQDVSLQLQYIERYLDIRAGNLEEYFRCSQKDLQECEELPPLPSPPPPPSEPQIVSNAVCKWKNSTSTCQQDQQGLIDLLTEAGEAHPFSLFMRCQYVSSKSQCNNLSTCVWENRACRISSKKLVAEINSCFYTDSYQYMIIPCKNELVSISNSTTWINQDSVNPASSCRQVLGRFSTHTNTCLLMNDALRCGERRRGRFYYPCDYASSISNQTYQFFRDLRYVMNVSQQDMSFTISYLEEYLDIRAGNLQEYFYCSQKDLQECEELPLLPSLTPPPSEAQDVSNAVCKWNNSTSTCQQDQQGLIDLLTQAGEAHIFSLFMTCQYVSDKSQCNNLSTCVWENRACRISSKKLVTEINSCLDTNRYKYSIIPCKKELVSIYYSTTWINQHSLNPASSCRQTVDKFSLDTSTCRLIRYDLQCREYLLPSYISSSVCEYASATSNLAYQFISDLQYVMNFSQQDVSLQLQYIERQLDIRAGNLQEYFYCSQKDLQKCEEPPPLPSSRQKSGLSGGVIAGIVIGVLTVLGLCAAFLMRRSINQRIQAFIDSRLRQINATSQNTAQAQNLELSQINTTQVQNRAQNQVARIGTADIIGALPSLEFMGGGENRSEQICVICLEVLKEGEVSTVLPCAHWFHKKCIQQWINNKGSNVTCPICNHPVSQQSRN